MATTHMARGCHAVPATGLEMYINGRLNGELRRGITSPSHVSDRSDRYAAPAHLNVAHVKYPRGVMRNLELGLHY